MPMKGAYASMTLRSSPIRAKQQIRNAEFDRRCAARRRWGGAVVVVLVVLVAVMVVVAAAAGRGRARVAWSE